MSQHKADAEALLGASGTDWESSNAIPARIEALTHATLALVEEQRTANLIAFLSAFDDGVPSRHRSTLVVDIRIALGIAP